MTFYPAAGYAQAAIDRHLDELERLEEAEEQATDWCDYCAQPLPVHFRLRAVGFTTLTDDGPKSPLVKAWCGACQTPDDIDLAADAAFMAALAAQQEHKTPYWEPHEAPTEEEAA